MTSLDMKGLSVSVLPVDDELLRALRSAGRAARLAARARACRRSRRCRCPRAWTRWPTCRRRIRRRRRARRDDLHDAHRDRERELDALDAKIGDGDTGSTFATAARAIVAELDRLPLAEPAALCASARRAPVDGDGRLERHPPLDRRGRDGRLARVLGVGRRGGVDGRPPSGPAAHPAVRRRERGRSHDARRARPRGHGARSAERGSSGRRPPRSAAPMRPRR